MNKTFLIAVAVAVAAFPLVCAGCGKSKAKAPQVTVLCAAGLRDPMTDLIESFEKDHAPATIRIDYAGTGELLGRMKVASAPEYRADVFVAAEESYAQQAQQLGLVDRSETLAYFTPVIVVAKGNPKGIHSLSDLARPGVSVALGESRGPAIGLVTDQILEKAGMMSIRKNAGGSFATVQAVAAQVALANADAGIIWDTTARQGDFPGKLDAIAIPDAPVVRVVICRVKGCPNPELADKFISYATTTEMARVAFRKYGFTVQLGATSSSATTVAK